jgi:hypothetical protein
VSLADFDRAARQDVLRPVSDEEVRRPVRQRILVQGRRRRQSAGLDLGLQPL